MTAPDIFISYGHEDHAAAKRFADAFAAAGLNVWWDTAIRSGEAFDEVIEAALKAAKAVVVLWSPRSAVSRWVRAEATIADRCKTLVPVTIEACERPIMFELTQTAELSHWTGDAKDKAWLAFLDDVRRFVGRHAAAPVAPVGDIPAPAPAKPGKRGGAPSLAVLPFTNRSGLPEDEVFAFGMVEDLIDALSLGVHARVLSSSSTARFRNGALPDVDAMGRELGVRYLLEGNVRRSGSDLRVTAQLIEAASGAILWIQKFDRPLTELASLQEALIGEVVAHLGTQFFRLEMEQALKKPGDLSAWECVMRAQAAHRQMTPETMALAVAESARAVAIEPDYGLAHAMLANSLALAYMYLSPDNPEELRRIRFHIDRALICDGENAAVLGQVADALANTDWPTEGLHRARRAIEINPSYGYAYFTAMIATGKLGLIDDALAYFADFRRIEPDSPYQHYAYSWSCLFYLQKGDHASAEAACDYTLAQNPSGPTGLLLKAVIASLAGRAEEARDRIREVRRHEPGTSLGMWELRFQRYWPAGPTLDTFLATLRALWPDTEGQT